MTQHDYRQKTRAVILAALMVTSVFGATVAFTGTAAADDLGTAGDTPDRNDVEYNRSTTIFQGQDISGIVGNESTTGSIQLRSIESFNADGEAEGTSFVRDLTNETRDVGHTATFTVDSDDLDTGDYIVTNGTVTTTESNSFEVVVQDLSASFDSDDLATNPETVNDSDVELDLSSGRDGYSFNVSADGDLDNVELFNLMLTAQLNDLNGSVVGPEGQIDYDEDGTYENSSLFAAFDGARNGNGNVLGSLQNTAPSVQVTELRNGSASNGQSDPSRSVGTLGDGLTVNGITVAAPYVDASGTDTDTANYDEKVTVTSGSIDELDVSFEGVDEATYDLTFGVTDTEAQASASAEVVEKNVDADFLGGTSTLPAGDIATLNISLTDTDVAYVQIGGESTSIVDALRVKVDDNSEPASVDINTRILGTNQQTSAVYSKGDNVDSLQSAIHSGNNLSAPESGNPIYDNDGSSVNGFAGAIGDGDNAGSYLDAMGLNSSAGGTSQLARPMQPTTYDVAIADPSAEDGLFDADDGGTPNALLDSKTLELTQPTVEDVTIHTAPEASADDTTEPAELLNEVTQTDEVAEGDRLVVQAEATGIFGSIVAAQTNDDTDDDFERTSGGVPTEDVFENIVASDRFNIVVEATASTGNAQPRKIDLEGVTGHSTSDVHIVTDEDGGQFFIIADTGSDSAFENGDAPDEQTTFEATVEYVADNDDNDFEFGDAPGAAVGAKDPFSVIGSGTHDNHPYLSADEVVGETATLDISPRSISYDNLNEDEVLQIPAENNATVSANTNVAPGSDAEIRLQSTNANTSFRLGHDVTIQEDGTISTTFDLGDKSVGDELEANFLVGGSEVASQDSVLTEAIGGDEEQTDEEQTDEEQTDEEQTDEGTDEEMDDEEQTDEEQTDEEQTDDGTPGFGAVVALVALVGAALLAVRRQN